MPATAKTVEDLEGQLHSLQAELHALPERARQCLIEGEDKEYRRLKLRGAELPHAITSVHVRLLKAQIARIDQRESEIAAMIPALIADLDRAESVLREAEHARNAAANELHAASEDRRDLSRHRGQLRLELDQLIYDASGRG